MFCGVCIQFSTTISRKIYIFSLGDVSIKNKEKTLMQSSLDYNGYLQFLIGLQTAKLAVAGKKEINLLLQ